MMRTVIISDITETSHSIIPYGLNIGKHTETKVDILHCFDPSIIQGTYSPYSDSQSVTPDRKLTHEEILDREKGITSNKLSHFLSREASVLNYPLRVNTVTEIGDIENCIAKQIKDIENPLVVTATRPGRSMVVDFQELLEVLFELDTMILIIPPGKKFTQPDKCCLVTDLQEETNKKTEKLFKWIDPLVTRVLTSAVVRVNHNSRHDNEIIKWKAALQPYAHITDIEALEVVHIDDMNIAFESICNRKGPDMAALPKNKNSFFSEYLLSGNNTQKLAETANIPLLLY